MIVKYLQSFGGVIMMEYEVFKKVIAERIKEFLPPVFNTYNVEITTVTKVNQKKDTLLIMPQEQDLFAAMPNIYLDDMYEAFKLRQNMDEILSFIAGLVVHYTGSFKLEEMDLGLSQRRDSIVMNLINTEKNRELLEQVPHREIMDLSVIYRIIMGENKDGLATVLVDNRILEKMKVSEEELESLAYVNTRRLFPAEIMKLSDLLYVMTNRVKIHGATTMICREDTQKLAERVGGSYFIIPSSIHEIMAVPENRAEAESLVRMLEEGNRSCGPENEILSTSIYHYDRESETLSTVASYS